MICSNDFAAVSLVRNLLEKAPDALEALKILSCAQTKLSAYYKTRITSVDMHFEQYGKAAVFLYEALKAHPYMAGMTVTVNWNDENEKTPRHKPVTAKNEQSGSAFYADGEMRDLLTTEQILNTCSDTDRLILFSLIDGATLEETATRSFLTEGGVKYRIRRILTACGISDRGTLLELLKKYLVIPRSPEQ